MHLLQGITIILKLVYLNIGCFFNMRAFGVVLLEMAHLQPG